MSKEIFEIYLRHNETYKKPLLAGDNIYIKSEVIEIKEKVIRLRHLMFNLETEGLVVETEITFSRICIRQVSTIVKERIASFVTGILKLKPDLIIFTPMGYKSLK